MDACGWDCLCAGPAFFIGLLYGNLDEVFDVVKRWNIDEIISAYKDSPKKGLKTILGKKSILDWSKDLFEISKQGLINRNELNSKKQNEVKFLDHIKTIIDTNSTNAEAIMAKYQKDKNFFNVNEKNKILAIQGDNLKKLNYKNDTTILAIEAQRLGSKIFYYEPKNIFIKNNQIYAVGNFIKLYDQKSFINY